MSPSTDIKPRDLWSIIRELETNAQMIEEALDGYSLADLKSAELYIKEAAWSIYPIHRDQATESYHKKNRKWEQTKRVDDQPLFWRYISRTARDLIAATLDDFPPAYYGIVVDVRSFVARNESNEGRLTFAAFDANPRTATQNIDQYIKKSISFTNVLFEIPDELRSPLLIEWRLNEHIISTFSDGELKGVHTLSFIGDPDKQSVERISSDGDTSATLALDRVLQHAIDSQKSIERGFISFNPTINGYRHHINSFRSLRRQNMASCSSFLAAFIPFSTARDNKGAIFLLFDLTDDLPKSGEQRFWQRIEKSSALIARCLDDYFNRLQTILIARQKGRREQINDFAHQWSKAINTLVDDIYFLPDTAIEQMRPNFRQRAILLSLAINSYRPRDLRPVAREFLFEHGQADHPLDAYCEIAVIYGLTRCAYSHIDTVKRKALNILEHIKHDGRRVRTIKDEYFLLPDAVPIAALESLRLDSTATLIISTIAQAFYHGFCQSILSNLRRLSPLTIQVQLKDRDNRTNYVVKNIGPPNEGTWPRDVLELAALADRLSPDDHESSSYSIDGPKFVTSDNCWRTTVSVPNQLKKLVV